MRLLLSRSLTSSAPARYVMRDEDEVCVVAELEPHVGTSDSGWLEKPVQAAAAGF